MGRTRIYSDGNERQRAYEQRKRERIALTHELAAHARFIAELARLVGVARVAASDGEALRNVTAYLAGGFVTPEESDDSTHRE